MSRSILVNDTEFGTCVAVIEGEVELKSYFIEDGGMVMDNSDFDRLNILFAQMAGEETASYMLKAGWQAGGAAEMHLFKLAESVNLPYGKLPEIELDWAVDEICDNYAADGPEAFFLIDVVES